MIEFSLLKEIGAVPSTYSLVEGKEPLLPEGLVWTAAKDGNLGGSTMVYGSNGNTVYRVNKETGVLVSMVLIDGALRVTSYLKVAHDRKKEKGDKSMEEKAMEIGIGKLDQFDSQFDSVLDSVTAANITAEPEKDSKTKEGKKGEKKEGEKILEGIREQISDIRTANNTPIIMYNQPRGRLLGFITRSNEVVKPTKKNVFVLENDKKVLTADGATTPAIKQKYEAGEKVPDKYYVKQKEVQWVQAKPNILKGLIIRTPLAGDVPLTKFYTDKVLEPEKRDDGTFKVHVMDKESAMHYLAVLYDGNILEDDSILGNKATTIKVKGVPVTKGNDVATGGKNIQKLRAKIEFQKDEAKNRNSLFVKGNYIPLSLYRTVKTQDMSEEEAAIANLSLEALLKDEQSYNELNDKSKARIHRAADGTITSEWFKPGISASDLEINSFDTKLPLTSINIPVRKKTQTKDGSKYVYKYDMLGLKDPDGPLSKPEYKDMLDLAGLSEEEFIKQVGVVERRPTTSKKKTNASSASEYLKWLAAQSQEQVPESIDTLTRILAGVSI